MTLLEVIKNASVNPEPLDSPSDYPVVLNPDTIIPYLKSEVEDINSSSLVKPLNGWQISQTDAELINIGKEFFSQLKKKLKNTEGLKKDEFINDLNSYLENIRDKVGVSIGINSSNKDYTRILIGRLGFFIGKQIAGLILEGCVSLEIWELVEALIVNGIIDHSCYSNLVTRLVEKNKSDLLCLCIKHGLDLGSSEILCILRYFLSPPRGSSSSMMTVRKEWENQALLAIEKASDNNLKEKNLLLAKEASLLLMIAYDGFSTSELYLHYLIASSNVNREMLSPAFSKLDGKEMMSLIWYLAKWLKKYERFPQVGPCSNASAALGLKACDWVPKLEDVAKCLSLVLDENFSSLVLHPEFHQEVISIEGMVSSLTAEAKYCCLMAEVVNKLKMEVKGGKK
ncbi:YLP motif-containing protein 1 [Senna tora]|uniref:YLP motif-containing protein 1 n=1 Tax=Senna tora TaxID=362788 RepID=A0A835CDM5_9FABA|nr:YLP motif-containing protein 1 [Senna tora]